MTINIPPEGKGALNLVCWVRLARIGYVEADVIEADAQTQKVTVRRRGSLFNFIVQFSAVQNVALKYDNGVIEKNFGAPKVNKPETIAYIQYAEVQS